MHSYEDVQYLLRSPIRALVNLLERSSRIVDEVLDDVAPECAVVIDPEQLEEFSGTFAYLLTWKLLLSLISSSPAEVNGLFFLLCSQKVKLPQQNIQKYYFISCKMSFIKLNCNCQF